MCTTPYRAIGNHLRTARNQLDLTQGQVAERAHISQNYYGEIERGDATPSIDVLILICDALHLPVPEAFRGVVIPKEGGVNHLLTDEEFLAFFATMNETVSVEKKAIMIGVCRLIASLDDRHKERENTSAVWGDDFPSTNGDDKKKQEQT